MGGGTVYPQPPAEIRPPLSRFSFSSTSRRAASTSSMMSPGPRPLSGDDRASFPPSRDRPRWP